MAQTRVSLRQASEEPEAGQVRLPDSPQCHEGPLGGPRSPVQPPLCLGADPAAASSRLHLLQSAAALHDPCLCSAASLPTAAPSSPHVRPMPLLLQDVRTAGPSPHSESHFSVPPRLVSRGCMDVLEFTASPQIGRQS